MVSALHDCLLWKCSSDLLSVTPHSACSEQGAWDGEGATLSARREFLEWAEQGQGSQQAGASCTSSR